MIFTKRRAGQTKRAALLPETAGDAPVYFDYRESTARRYEKLNTFISAMEFVKATATIATHTNLAIKIGDKIRLEEGVTLRVAELHPDAPRRSSGAFRADPPGWIINLE